MSLFNKVITKVFGKKSDKDLKKIAPIISDINVEFDKLKNLSDQEIKDKFNSIKLKLKNLIDQKNKDLNASDLDSSEIEKINPIRKRLFK